MICKHCNSTRMIVRGYTKTRRGRKKNYQCKDCLRYTTPSDLAPHRQRTAKILMLDIETSLMKFYGFSPKVDYIPHEMMIEDWSIICWGAKWLFGDEVFGEVVTPQEAIARKDESVLGGIWNLIDQADICVTQNGIKFDMKKLNSRFLMAGYSPPSYYANVDTLKVAKDVFGWSYNHLDFLGNKFGIGQKSKMEIDDWIECSNGNPEYLDKMFRYCKRDVAPLLEDVYLRILPWIPNHPNMNLYTNQTSNVCPKCESSDLEWGGRYATPQGLWEGFRCQSCGAIGRGTKARFKIKGVDIKD